MSINPTKYTLRPTEDDRIFIKFINKKNKITSFVIQYYSKTPKGWRTIKRFDTAHGYAHEEFYGHSKTKKIKTIALKGNYNYIFTQAQRQITQNWKKIKDNYMFQ